MVLGNWNNKDDRNSTPRPLNGIPAGAESDSDYYMDFESEDEFDDVFSGHRVHTTVAPGYPYKELFSGIPSGFRVWRLRRQHHVFKIWASTEALAAVFRDPIPCPIDIPNTSILYVSK